MLSVTAPVLQRDLPFRFPAIIHEPFLFAIGSAPPLKKEAIDPLACGKHLAGPGIRRDIRRKAVEALRKAGGHRYRKRTLPRR